MFTVPFHELSLVGLALDLVVVYCCSIVGCVHVTRKSIPEMTYNVSSGTLNSTIPYNFSHNSSPAALLFFIFLKTFRNSIFFFNSFFMYFLHPDCIVYYIVYDVMVYSLLYNV